ncbi:MAG: hypothetical protein KatS3mg059_1085 [Thermomicrobiales bacterium]|nr:MAG: hypothetical protein KatS3mg059_1085 [Thermomicrobiales bacterium]
MLLVASMGGWAVEPAAAGTITPSRFYAEETGHSLSEPFLSYWVRHDGLSQLGLPVSEPVTYARSPGPVFPARLSDCRRSIEPDPHPPRVRIVRGPGQGRTCSQLRHDPDRLVAGRRAGSDRALGGIQLNPYGG